MASTAAMTFNLFGKDVSASKALKGVGESASKLGRGLKSDMGIGFAAVGFSAAKVASVVKGFGTDSVKAFVDAEQSQLRLQDAFAKFPNMAGASVASISALAEATAMKTRFDDDATKAAAAQLGQFGLTGQQITELLPLVQDLAAKTGTDLATAAQTAGKAIMGQGRGLKGVGINFKDTGNKAGNLAQLVGGLNEKVGGFAEKEGKSAAGQAAILSNQYGEMKESIGAALLPVLTDLGRVLIDDVVPPAKALAEWVQKNTAWLIPLAGGVLAVVGAYKIWTTTTKALAEAKIMFAAAQNSSALATVGATAKNAAHAASTGVVTAATWAQTVAQRALNFALMMNPIGLVVLAIVALVAIFVVAWQRSETFRTVVTAAWNGIKAAALAVVNWFRNTAWPAIQAVLRSITGAFTAAWSGIKSAWSGFAGFFRGIFGAVAGFVKGYANTILSVYKAVWSGIKAAWSGFSGFFRGLFNGVAGIAKSAFRGVIGVVNAVIRGVNTMISGFNRLPGPDIGTIPQVALAAGGIVTRPTTALIGEAGPEAVIPLSRSGMFGGGTTVNVTVNGAVGDRQALGRFIVGAIDDAIQSGTVRPRRLATV